MLNCKVFCTENIFSCYCAVTFAMGGLEQVFGQAENKASYGRSGRGYNIQAGTGQVFALPLHGIGSAYWQGDSLWVGKIGY